MSPDRGLEAEFRERQIAMFGMFVDKGRFTTRAALAVATGYSPSSLRDWAGGTTMPAHALLRLRKFLPAEAINMLTEVGDARLVDAEKSETNWNALAASSAGLTSEICGALADGQIDHVERARLKTKARELIAEAQHAVEEG